MRNFQASSGCRKSIWLLKVKMKILASHPIGARVPIGRAKHCQIAGNSLRTRASNVSEERSSCARASPSDSARPSVMESEPAETFNMTGGLGHVKWSSDRRSVISMLTLAFTTKQMQQCSLWAR